MEFFFKSTPSYFQANTKELKKQKVEFVEKIKKLAQEEEQRRQLFIIRTNRDLKPISIETEAGH